MTIQCKIVRKIVQYKERRYFSMQTDVIIVGGGASGLVTAVMCARDGKRVLLFEQKKQIGKKLLATGNGKCNYTNKNQTEACYRSENKDFPQYGLSAFGYKEAISFFEELGITPKEKQGYIYPYSEQAVAFVEALEMEIKKRNVQVCYEKVVQIQQKKNGKFCVLTEQASYQSEKLVLAAGGKASPKLGSDGSGYVLAKQMGHRIIAPVPALIGLKCREDFYETVAGVRIQAKVTLYIESMEQAIAEDTGELQLTNYGISGIPVFQISRYAARAIEEEKSVYAKLDFMPAFSKIELEEICRSRFSRSEISAEQALIGLLNKKLIQLVLHKSGIRAKQKANKVNEMQCKQLVNTLKGMKTQIIGTNGFEHAQVTAGGVDTVEIDNKTMESKIVKGLYFTGEIMDVDGICGGYNLQWCWSSAYLASTAICK